MGDQTTVWTVLGATKESVMALYGVARLLKSRDLGPAQLAPAIESSRAEALKLRPRLQRLFDLLREPVAESPHLEAALEVLEPYATDVAQEVAEAFSRRGLSRLGARERLLLERRAEDLGAELDGIRAQLELVCAALQFRPVDLLLANVVDGRSGQPPTFVSKEANLLVDLAGDRGFAGDPKVLWPLFEAALRQLSSAGDTFVLQARGNGDDGFRVQIRPADEQDKAEGDAPSVRLSLGSAIRVEREVVGAVARHLGIDYEVADDAPAITIAVG